VSSDALHRVPRHYRTVADHAPPTGADTTAPLQQGDMTDGVTGDGVGHAEADKDEVTGDGDGHAEAVRQS
jgi:hypothetical protein